MKRLTKVLAVAAAVLVAAELLIRASSPLLPPPLSWYSYWAEEKVERISAAPDRPQVVFLGDSTVMSALDPGRFASDTNCLAFNAATPGASLAILLDWWERAVAPKWQPELVVIGLTSRTASAASESEYFESIAVRDDASARLTRVVAEHSALVEYRSVIRDPQRLVSHYQALLGGEDPEPWEALDSLGWSGRGTGQSYVPRLDDGPLVKSRRDVSAENLDALRSLIRAVEAPGALPVVAWMPVTQDWVESHQGGASSHREARDAVAATTASSGGLFIDLSSIDDNRLFTDPIHLNDVGADEAVKLLTDRLADELDWSSNGCRDTR